VHYTPPNITAYTLNGSSNTQDPNSFIPSGGPVRISPASTSAFA